MPKWSVLGCLLLYRKQREYKNGSVASHLNSLRSNEFEWRSGGETTCPKWLRVSE